MTALEIVDAAAPGRVLVVGTLPPQGRDLDVLAPAAAVPAIKEALRRNGFVARRSTWARFTPFELVDLRVLSDESLLADLEPLPGYVHVCRGAVPATPRSRVARRWRRVRESGVVALSGLDGSGKTTQAERLRDALVATGFDAVVEWNRLSHDHWLDVVARPVKRVLGRDGGVAAGSGSGSGGSSSQQRGRGAWVVVVGLANAIAHLRSVRRHALAGRIVVCDRYVLDSIVQLEAKYPAGLGQRLAVALVRWLSPRPRVAFYLDVPAEVTLERKPRPGREEARARQAAAYRTTAARLGVVSVDGTLPVDELAADIARETWRRV